MTALSPPDLAMLAVVLAGLLAAGLWPFVASALDQRPAARIRRRLRAMDPRHERGQALQIQDTLDTTRALREASSWMRHWQLLEIRIHALGGRQLVVILAAAGAGAGMTAFLLAHRVFDFPAALSLALAPVAALLTVLLALSSLEARRTRRFLDSFPEALDYLIRSVRAGIPVGHAVRLAAGEMGEPIGPEFRHIGDSLAVGIDLKEALDEACQRIAIPDFTFFAVCLTLQRETGGQLTATLENLAGILRQRRDIRLKAKAITAEGRMSAKIIGSLPLLTLGALYLMTPGYVAVLFNEPAGRRMLSIAALLLTCGMLVIRRLTNLRS